MYLNTEQEDAKFFEYANEVLEQAKRTGRPTYPIEKVIMVIIFTKYFFIYNLHLGVLVFSLSSKQFQC